MEKRKSPQIANKESAIGISLDLIDLDVRDKSPPKTDFYTPVFF